VPNIEPTAPALCDFILLNEEIAALARARLPLESQLARLGTELPGKSAQRARRIGDRMARGESLTTAMDAECASLPGAYRATLLAGIESGELPAALESLVNAASRMDQLRRVTGIAMLYPIVILMLGSVLLGLLFSWVVPSFDWLDKAHYGPLRDIGEQPWLLPALMLIAPCLIFFIACLSWWQSGRIGGGWSTRPFGIGWLPWVRGVRYWAQAGAFAELLGMLVERGVPFERALELTAEATDVRRFRAAASRLADQARAGNLARSGHDPTLREKPDGLPPLIRLALHYLSDRRLLARILRQASEAYHDRAVRAAEWYGEYLPILLTVAIGGTITVLFALLVFWPYASMLHEITNWKS
jgi:type II secretory pathway component PulF